MPYLRVLTDLAGASLGDLRRAYDRRYSPALSGLPTSSLRLRLDDPMADEIISRDGDVMLKIYQEVGTWISGSLGSSGDVTVNSTRGWPQRGNLRIEAEIVSYTGLTATQFTGCTRGAGGTSAASHPSGTIVMPLKFFGECADFEVVGAPEGESLFATFEGGIGRLAHRSVGLPYPGAQRAWVETAANQVVDAIVNQTNTNSDSGIRLGVRDVFYPMSGGVEGSWLLKPALEALAEMRESQVPWPVESPPSYSRRDIFAVPPHSVGDITGQSDELGHTWNWPAFGNTRDFGIQAGGGYLYRGWTSDAGAAAGRWVADGNSITGPILAGIEWSASYFGSVPTLYSGFFVRLQDADNWVLIYNNVAAKTIAIDKKVNGSQTTIATFTYPSTSDYGFNPSTLVWYQMLALIDEAGAVTVWQRGIGLTLDAPKIQTTPDPDLAEDGPLNAGQCGPYDAQTSAGASNRFYTTWLVAPFTGPQSFDYEVQPQEPVLDGAGYPNPRPVIGVLNMRQQIGVERPDAIFEFGDTARGYRLRTDRKSLLNVGYTLPPNFEAGVTPAAEIRAAVDSDSIAARGQHEGVVPNDLQSSQLRQALVDAHVRVRRRPRKLLTFDPMGGREPVLGLDYDVGDVVTARARGRVATGTPRVNGQVRVYEAEVVTDDEDRDVTTPTVVPE